MRVSNKANGLAFEYAIITEYAKYFEDNNLKYEIQENDAYYEARDAYEKCKKELDERSICAFHESAKSSILLISQIEPGLMVETDDEDIIQIERKKDSEGEEGDVRDVLFKRTKHNWELGISAKNNNNFIKHSRLSDDKKEDFVRKWKIGPRCSESFYDKIKDASEFLRTLNNPSTNVTKEEIRVKAYLPYLNAFIEEINSLKENNNNIAACLIKYFVGTKPYYKLIKDDKNNLLIIEAYNLAGRLNLPIKNKNAKFKIPKQLYPSRIDYIGHETKANGENSHTTICINFNHGWEASLRIHTASSKKSASLKLEVSLIGTPAKLFTTHIFTQI